MYEYFDSVLYYNTINALKSKYLYSGSPSYIKKLKKVPYMGEFKSMKSFINLVKSVASMRNMSGESFGESLDQNLAAFREKAALAFGEAAAGQAAFAEWQALIAERQARESRAIRGLAVDFARTLTDRGAEPPASLYEESWQRTSKISRQRQLKHVDPVSAWIVTAQYKYDPQPRDARSETRPHQNYRRGLAIDRTGAILRYTAHWESNEQTLVSPYIDHPWTHASVLGGRQWPLDVSGVPLCFVNGGNATDAELLQPHGVEINPHEPSRLAHETTDDESALISAWRARLLNVATEALTS